MPPRARSLAVVLAVGVIAGGCGAGASTASRSVPAKPPAPLRVLPAPSSPLSPPRSIPAPAPTGVTADPGSVKVIRAWSQALLRGDVRGAAGYFALPSELINGTDTNGVVSVITIRNRREARVANLTLPCGARFVSADQRGLYVNVLFRLTARPGPGGGCGSGAGQLARTNFVVMAGRIVEWIRAPLDPGDGGRSARPPTSPPVPQSPPPSSPQGSPVI